MHEIADEEITDPEIAGQLLEFINGVMAMDEATGKIPDMFGRPVNPLHPRFYNPRYADNICVVEDDFGAKRVYLMDIGAITAIAENKSLRHKTSMKLVRRRLRKLKRELERVKLA